MSVVNKGVLGGGGLDGGAGWLGVDDEKEK